VRCDALAPRLVAARADLTLAPVPATVVAQVDAAAFVGRPARGTREGCCLSAIALSAATADPKAQPAPAPAARRRATNAATSVGSWWWALRPLGLGSSQTRVSPMTSGCRPGAAEGRAKAAR